MEKLISFKKLLQNSWAMYKEKFPLMARIALVNLPFLPFSYIASSYTGEALMRQFSARPLFFSLAIVLFLILWLSAIIISLWSQLSLTLAVGSTNNSASALQVLRSAWRKLNSYIWVSFLMGIITAAGFVLFIIPGIVFAFWFVFAPYLFALENLKGMEALKQSMALVSGYWWSVFSRFLVFFLIAMMVSLVFSFAPLLGSLVNIFFIMPAGVIYGYLVYEDLKRMKRAFQVAA